MALPLKQSVPAAGIAAALALNVETSVQPGQTYSGSVSGVGSPGSGGSQPLPAWRVVGPAAGAVVSYPVGNGGLPPLPIVEAYQNWADGHGNFLTDQAGWNLSVTGPTNPAVNGNGQLTGTCNVQVQVPTAALLGAYTAIIEWGASFAGQSYVCQTTLTFTVWSPLGLTVTGTGNIGTDYTVEVTTEGAGGVLQALEVGVYLDDVALPVQLLVSPENPSGTWETVWNAGTPLLTIEIADGATGEPGTLPVNHVFSSLTFGTPSASAPASTLPATVGTGTLRAMSPLSSNAPTAAISAQEGGTRSAATSLAGDATSRQLVAAMSMAQGGGAPHLHLAIAKTRTAGGAQASWPVIVASSDNFGETFGPGVDVGAAAWQGTLFGAAENQTLSGDNVGTVGEPVITSFVALPGGGIYLNGQGGGDFQLSGSGALKRNWQSARICRNPSAAIVPQGKPGVASTVNIWRAVETPNQQPDTLISGQPAPTGANKAAQWGTAQTSPGAHGAGVKTGGAWQIRSGGLSWGGSQTVAAWANPPLVFSVDSGDTWQNDSGYSSASLPPGSTGNGVMIGQAQYDGEILSSDGFRLKSVYLPIAAAYGQSPTSYDALAVGGDGETACAIVNQGPGAQTTPLETVGSGSQAQAAPDAWRTVILGASKTPGTVNGAQEVPAGLSVLYSFELVYSRTSDGSNLAPIYDPAQGAQVTSGLAAWYVSGTVVLACYPNFAPNQLSIFVSHNAGAWYRLACYSLDDGATWVQNKVTS